MPGNVRDYCPAMTTEVFQSLPQTLHAELTVGRNDYGHDVNFYGDTSGKKFFWDESADTCFLACTVDIDGTVTVGVDDTGYDVKFFGATASKYWLWDEGDDKVVLVGAMDQTGNFQLTGTLTVGVNDTGHDVKFFGATASKYWLWDESEDKVVLLGAMDMTGGFQLTGALTVGVDDTGHDVKLFGATSGKYWLWDESEDKAILLGAMDQTGNFQLTGTLTVGVDDTGHDVTLYGATSGKYLMWDESDDKAIVSGVLQSGTTATAALAIGGGTSSAPLTTAVADKNFLGFWTQSTATSGDSRGLYLRHYLGGTIASTGYGDAVRAFATVTGTGYSSATGIHSTCQVNAAGSVTGLGVGIRTSLANDSEVAQGTLACLLMDTQGSKAVSATEYSYLRASSSHTGTGAAPGYFAILEGVDTTNCFVANTDTPTKGIKIKVNGTDYWLAVNEATS